MTTKRHSNGYYVLLGGWRLLWGAIAVVALVGPPTLGIRLFSGFLPWLSTSLGEWYYLIVTPFALAWVILVVLYIFLPTVIKIVWPIEAWLEKRFDD